MTMPPYYPSPAPQPAKSKMPFVALILGIGALLTFWTLLGGIIFGIAAIILGIKGRSRAKSMGVPAGAATGGIAAGAIATVISVALAAWAATLPTPKTEAKPAPASTTAAAVQTTTTATPTTTTTQPTTTPQPPSTTTTTSPPVPASASASASADGTHGIVSVPVFWDQHFTKATKGDCLDQGDSDLESGVAWWISPGVLFCATDPNRYGTWQGRIIGGHLHFRNPTDADTATKAARQLLPDDAKELRQVQGRNPSWSTGPTGTCKSIEYHSDTVAKIVSSINPTWENADRVEFTLYSDRISPPSPAAYDGSHVQSMLVDIGAPLPNSDGTYDC